MLTAHNNCSEFGDSKKRGLRWYSFYRVKWWKLISVHMENKQILIQY